VAAFSRWDLNLYINPITLKLEGDLDILKMYLHTDDEVARLRHSMDKICMANEKNTKIALKVKGQGQMSPTSNHF